MKRAFLKIALSFIFLLASLPLFASTETYQIDPQHSFVEWQVDHMFYSNQTGKWPVNGTIVLDQQHPQLSHVSVTINVADMVTGVPALNKQLRGHLFFDTKKYPTATFVSNKVIMTGKNIALIQGLLTLHGVSKTITIRARVNKIGINPINNKKSIGVSAITEISRTHFDINGFVPDISDLVRLDIEVEAAKSE